MGPMAGLEAGAGHAFAQATLREEVTLEATELLVEQVVGLVNEADEDVGDYLERARLEIGRIGPIRRIGPIGRIR
ncbi:hypothetical protein BH20VER3_BH20VER3_20710 [soil metagenome]